MPSDGLQAKQLMGRINRIPAWAFPASFIAIIGIGYFFVFFDITDIGFAMPAIATQFNLTGSEGLFIALAVGLIGYIIGSYAIGTIADRHGRLKVMIATMVLIALGSFGDALSTGIITLSLWRFVTGLGVGAELNLVSTYIGELSPPGIRGKISVLTFLIGIIGQAITPFVALLLVPTLLIGWRLLFAIGGLIALIAVAAMTRLPESPRWLVVHRRLREAELTIRRMEEFVRGKGIRLPKPVPASSDPSRGRFPTAYLFKKRYAARLAVLASMWFLWYIGNYAFLGDAATLLSAQGITVSNSILFLAIGAIGYPVGAIFMILAADRFERKFLIAGSTAVWLAGMLLVGSLAGNIAVMAGSFLASLALGSYLQVAYTFTAESYPTRARSSGFALSDGIGHLGGVVGALLLPFLVTSLGFFSGFAIIGVTGLAAGLVALAGPSVSKLTLEQVSG